VRARTDAATWAQQSKLARITEWGRKFLLFTYPVVTACCGMELMSVQGPKYDMARFGAEVPRFSPGQSDLLMIVGIADELLAYGPRPAALYTAALVHAYLGDREIATKYATAYLDGGNSPADLAYPWFDDLRRDPGLGPRLAVPAAARTCEAGSGH
jgi:hypothetical protein